MVLLNHHRATEIILRVKEKERGEEMRAMKGKGETEGKMWKETLKKQD